MAIRVKEMHHHGIRIPTACVDEVRQFYTDVLGLATDSSRPNIPGIPGAWIYVGEEGGPTTQIHVIGSDGVSPVAKSAQQDPTRFHVALAVEDIEEARSELYRRDVPYWIIEGLVGPNSLQVFFDDPAGNMVELHQVGSCSCNRQDLKP